MKCTTSHVVTYSTSKERYFRQTTDYKEFRGMKESRNTLILVYKGCMNLQTRGIPYYFQNFDSFYPLFFSTFPMDGEPAHVDRANSPCQV